MIIMMGLRGVCSKLTVFLNKQNVCLLKIYSMFELTKFVSAQI